MKYYLGINTLDRPPLIEISKIDYVSAKKAHIALSNGLQIEEIYEILISNYIEFENEVSGQATIRMVRNDYEYADFFYSRVKFNIRLVNLLTSARLYVDQLGRLVKKVVNDNDSIVDDVKKLFEFEYNAFHEYRFMEALRNHVQHKGVPVHLARYGKARDVSGNDNFLVFSADVFSNKSLLSDSKFKKSVLDEIHEKVDLKHATRMYLECLSRIHADARKITTEKLQESKQLIKEYIERYKSVHAGSLVGLEVIQSDGTEFHETIPLSLEWEETRSKFVKRNPQLVYLSKRYVSTKVKSS